MPGLSSLPSSLLSVAESPLEHNRELAERVLEGLLPAKDVLEFRETAASKGGLPSDAGKSGTNTPELPPYLNHPKGRPTLRKGRPKWLLSTAAAEP